METKLKDVTRAQAGSTRVGLVIAGACLGLLVLGGGMVGGCVFMAFGTMRASGAYQEAVRELRKHPAAREALGEPMEEGWFVNGSVNVSGPAGEAKLAIPVNGPKGQGTLYVEAVKRAGQWEMSLLQLAPPGGQRIDLLPGSASRQTALRSRCEAGKAADCNDLGVIFLNGQGVAKDLAAAAALFRRACDGGIAVGCSNLGVLYEDGSAVTKDVVRAAALYKQACDAGDAHGCFNLGTMHEDGSGLTKDLARAASLYKQACDAGEAHGCSNLGVLYETGSGVAKDVIRAAALLKQACDGGLAMACERLERSGK